MFWWNCVSKFSSGLEFDEYDLYNIPLESALFLRSSRMLIVAAYEKLDFESEEIRVINFSNRLLDLRILLASLSFVRSTRQ